MPAILLTRPVDGAARFAKVVRARLGDVSIVTSPVLEIEGTGAQPDLSDAPLLLFTSRNGVRFGGIGLQKDLDCLTVGDATAAAAREAGLTARSAGGDVDDLIALLDAERPESPILHLRGAHSTGDLVETLRGSGMAARELIVYDQRPVPLSDAALAMLGGEIPVIVPLFSPRSAELFTAQHCGGAPLFIAAISDAVAERAASLPHVALCVAARPTMDDMLDCVSELFDASAALEGGSQAQ